MSIMTKLNRIITLRNGLRTKLIALGLVSSTAKLEDCKTAVVAMVDNTKKTATGNPVSGSFFSGATGYIYGKIGAGYCSASTVLRVPLTNFAVENIKQGVNMGGLVGAYQEKYTGYRIVFYDMFNRPFTTPLVYRNLGNIKGFAAFTGTSGTSGAYSWTTLEIHTIQGNTITREQRMEGWAGPSTVMPTEMNVYMENGNVYATNFYDKKYNRYYSTYFILFS